MVRINGVRVDSNIKPNPVLKAGSASKDSIWKANINGEIEDTIQGDIGDCWLLTNLNCLRDTKWGKRMIKESIKSDGEGGAIITFKGAKPAPMTYHITVEDIIKANESGIYSSGDDDVLAIELATEKYLKMRRNQEYKRPGEALYGNGYSVSEFAELLSGKKCAYHFTLPPLRDSLKELDRSHNERMRILKEIEKHPGEYAVRVDFRCNSMDGVLRINHAYQLKKVITEKNKKYAILVDPNNSSKIHKLEVDTLIMYLGLMEVTEAPGAEPNENLKSDNEIAIEALKREGKIQ